MNIPDGWQLVPKRPTGEMVAAFDNAGGFYSKGGKNFATFSERYEAMLAVTPSAPLMDDMREAK